jgi:signal transduction histidine kinase
LRFTIDKYNNYINAYRYLILGGAIAGTLLKIPMDMYPLFTLGSLIFIVNIQLRAALNKHMLFLISIILDVLIFCCMYFVFSGYTYFLLILTLIDIMLRLKTESYSLSCIVTIAYIYSVITSNTMEISLIFIAFYSIIFLMLLHLRKELSLKTNAEELYEQLRRSNYELDAARSRLINYSKQIEKVTKLEERNRISRELHDSIGHNLTGILMQVDAARQVIEVDSNKGMKILESVYKNINSSIENVRQTVREIRPSKYQTHKSSTLELINRFSKETGINVEYKTSGTPHELLPSIEMVLYRNIQEALTNAVRHGGATNILVNIIYKHESTEVVISDNGTGCMEIIKGLGLSGMEERLEIIGGSIRYETKNGFLIHMTIPGGEL